jgi:hypothetical protein
MVHDGSSSDSLGGKAEHAAQIESATNDARKEVLIEHV